MTGLQSASPDGSAIFNIERFMMKTLTQLASLFMVSAGLVAAPMVSAASPEPKPVPAQQMNKPAKQAAAKKVTPKKSSHKVSAKKAAAKKRVAKVAKKAPATKRPVAHANHG